MHSTSVPTKSDSLSLCMRFWHGRNPASAHSHVLSCLAYSAVPVKHHSNLDDKAVNCSFDGHYSQSKGYRSCHTQTKDISATRAMELWKILSNRNFHATGRQMYANEICMAPCYLFSKEDSQTYHLTRLMLTLCKFQISL
jgi:hypothetical protein